MKLSEAMEKGWQGRDKIQEAFQRRQWRPAKLGGIEELGMDACCALGAACYEVEPDRWIEDIADVRRYFPEIETEIDLDYFTGPYSRLIKEQYEEPTLANIIIIWNDDTDMEKDEIIEAVKGLGY